LVREPYVKSKRAARRRRQKVTGPAGWGAWIVTQLQRPPNPMKRRTISPRQLRVYHLSESPRKPRFLADAPPVNVCVWGKSRHELTASCSLITAIVGVVSEL
jgi:hypothetical protein